MKVELQNKLILKHKNIFRNDESNTPYNMFGIECGDGWYNILDDLMTKIGNHLEQNPEVKLIYIMQIKEKFGELRFYYNGGDEYINNLVEFTEKESKTTCESCGKPGEKTDNGWIKTLCIKC